MISHPPALSCGDVPEVSGRLEREVYQDHDEAIAMWKGGMCWGCTLDSRGEFTAQKTGTAFDPAVHLSRNSIQFRPSFKNATHVILTLPASKTDPFWKGISITVAAAPRICLCPVTALKLLFERAPHTAGKIPLFENPDGAVLHCGTFIATTCNTLLAAGCDTAL
ncbi:hypothetical protein FIBSPDRAFT_970448 [Athelia psychrophila]|uniref:Uncharacterized protein n=1 Tax=Athelia psychrophila TaxID=1759441 RepID=A0A167SPB9_9AGAM|nr:hypothetical protein FIBSPDRAFT_970448 [Fibularhizoctonia sp. CBS 109695]